MAETEVEEYDAKCNANNVTMNNFIQSPVMINAPRNKTNTTNEKRIILDNLAETIRVLNRLTLQSTIKNSADYHS